MCLQVYIHIYIYICVCGDINIDTYMHANIYIHATEAWIPGSTHDLSFDHGLLLGAVY